MTAVKLSKQDIDYIARVVDTEVNPGWARSHPEVHAAMVAAVVDTIVNRVASTGFPDKVTDVVNAQNQFSKINGPDRLNPYGSVQAAPKAQQATFDIVESHLTGRARGLPSSIGAHVNYANPHHSDKKNREGWINPMIEAGAVRLGIGESVHYHGTAKGAVQPGSYAISIDGLEPTPDTFGPTGFGWSGTNPSIGIDGVNPRSSNVAYTSNGPIGYPEFAPANRPTDRIAIPTPNPRGFNIAPTRNPHPDLYQAPQAQPVTPIADPRDARLAPEDQQYRSVQAVQATAGPRSRPSRPGSLSGHLVQPVTYREPELLGYVHSPVADYAASAPDVFVDVADSSIFDTRVPFAGSTYALGSDIFDSTPAQSFGFDTALANSSQTPQDPPDTAIESGLPRAEASQRASTNPHGLNSLEIERAIELFNVGRSLGMNLPGERNFITHSLRNGAFPGFWDHASLGNLASPHRESPVFQIMHRVDPKISGAFFDLVAEFPPQRYQELSERIGPIYANSVRAHHLAMSLTQAVEDNDTLEEAVNQVRDEFNALKAQAGLPYYSKPLDHPHHPLVPINNPHPDLYEAPPALNVEATIHDPATRPAFSLVPATESKAYLSMSPTLNLDPDLTQAPHRDPYTPQTFDAPMNVLSSFDQHGRHTKPRAVETIPLGPVPETQAWAPAQPNDEPMPSWVPAEQAPPIGPINDSQTRSLTPDSLLEYAAQPASYTPPSLDRVAVTMVPANAPLSPTGLDANGFISAPVTSTLGRTWGQEPIAPSDNYGMLSAPVTNPDPNVGEQGVFTTPGSYQRSAPGILSAEAPADLGLSATGYASSGARGYAPGESPYGTIGVPEYNAAVGSGRGLNMGGPAINAPSARAAANALGIDVVDVPISLTDQVVNTTDSVPSDSFTFNGVTVTEPATPQQQAQPSSVQPSQTQETTVPGVSKSRSFNPGGLIGGVLGGALMGPIGGIIGALAGNRMQGSGILGSMSESIQDGGLSSLFSGMQAPGQWMGGNFAQNDAFSSNPDAAIDPNTGWQSFTNQHGVTTLTGGLKAFPEDAQPMVSNAGLGGGPSAGKGG